MNATLTTHQATKITWAAETLTRESGKEYECVRIRITAEGGDETMITVFGEPGLEVERDDES